MISPFSNSVTLMNKECGDGARDASVSIPLPQGFGKAETMRLAETEVPN